MENLRFYFVVLFVLTAAIGLALPLTTLPLVLSGREAGTPGAPTVSPQTEMTKMMTPQQLHNIMDALIGASDFSNWADVFALTDPYTFPLSATIFIPTNDDIVQLFLDLDPSTSLLLSHTVPHQLTFKDLQKLQIGYHLDTLIPEKSMIVTNNSGSYFTLDDEWLISYPDMVINGAFTLHGVRKIVNNHTVNCTEPGEFSPQDVAGESTVGRPNSSDAAEFQSLFLSFVCAALPLF